MLADLKTLALSALIDLVDSAEAKQRHLDMLPGPGDTPLFPATMLDLAETFASHGMADKAARLLDATRYGEALTVSTLSFGGEPEAIDHDFRYWRLRRLLAPDEAVPDPVPPDQGTPAGDDITSSAAVPFRYGRHRASRPNRCCSTEPCPHRRGDRSRPPDAGC